MRLVGLMPYTTYIILPNYTTITANLTGVVLHQQVISQWTEEQIEKQSDKCRCSDVT
ncbi:MAG: hypothetical protein U9R57_03575 [Thermodesulfobacteriota bacterium]|nr:hypothetical protein [Thermodesulfobacteriota bacterium]